MMSPQIITTNSRARGEAHLADVDDVAGRRAAQLRVGRERVLRLRDAHRIAAVAVVLQALDLGAHGGRRRHLGCAVDARRDRAHLVPQRRVVGVGEPQGVDRLGPRSHAEPHHLARELLRTRAALGEVPRDHRRGADGLDAATSAAISASVSSARWLIATTAGRSPGLADRREVPHEIGDAALERRDVLVRQVGDLARRRGTSSPARSRR